MSGVGAIGGFLVNGGLTRIGPEPRNNVAGVFKQVLGVAGAVADNVVPGISGDYASLIQTQIRVQQEMMMVSMYSNIEKSKHETSMAAVRNMRVG